MVMRLCKLCGMALIVSAMLELGSNSWIQEYVSTCNFLRKNGKLIDYTFLGPRI